MENLNGMTQVLILAGTISIVVMILLQLLKKMDPTFEDKGKRARFLPAIAILIGLVIGALVYPFTDLELTLRLWSGFFAGAGASGLYDLTKTTKPR